FAAKLPLLYCPSEPRGHQSYNAGGGWWFACTWYLGVVGLDYHDGQSFVYLGNTTYATYDVFPEPSRSGILSYTQYDFRDSTGRRLGLAFHGGKVSQVTDGLSNTAMIGERPPSPNLNWGWWTSPEQDVLMGAAETTLIYTNSGIDSNGNYLGP